MDTYREGDWEADASCKGAAIDDFFREKSSPPAYVKKLCAQCPVRSACLESALAEERGSKKRYGYRGGKTARQRQSIYVSRQRSKRLASKLATRAGRRSDAESTYR